MDVYDWNQRLKEIKLALIKKELPKENLEEMVYDALMSFQPPFQLMIMRWANDSGIGPGFVVE